MLAFWQEQGGRAHRILRHAAGPEAIEAYLDDPLDTRLIMSMKTYLAQRSFSQTQVFGRPHTPGAAGRPVPACRAGRARSPRTPASSPDGRCALPGSLADDTLGEARLREGYRQAGLGEVEVVLEPQAAGYRFTRTLDGAATVLIGDFGGGTSDFSLLRFESGAAQRVICRWAAPAWAWPGDSFDSRIIDHVVSPSLGKGSTYRG